MARFTRFAFALAAAAALTIAPSMAETKKAETKKQAESKKVDTNSSEEKGVQDAIAYQRAKDRADAEQARKEARHPEQFATPAPAPKKGSASLANQQRKEALEHSPKQSDRPAPPKQ